MSLRTPLVLCSCLLLAACSKVNQENYAKLEAGMARSQVEQLLGSPAECSGAAGLSSCNWVDGKASISVQFAADKVLMYSGQGLE